MDDDAVLEAARIVLQDRHPDDASIPIQAVMIVVAMEETGKKFISHFTSGDLRTWEARGLIGDMHDSLAAVEVARMFEDE